MNLNKNGITKEEILHILESYKQQDLKWRSGKVFAYVYDAGKEAEDIIKTAYTMYLSENCLDPTTFPSTLKLETDVVRMIANLLRGDEEVVGNVSSGGTESIMLAVKTARDKARAEHPEITEPEMIVCPTTHGAFHKAAHYLGLKPVMVTCDPETFRLDVQAMENAITENTILLVGSAPNYSHGVIDPIAEIGELAQKYNLFFHVDACVGGLHLSIMRKMGHEVPDFDFSVPGVTSISTDLHKFGYSAKGASVILYRNKDIRRYQIFACMSTTAYTLINTTVLSSKSAGPLAGAWAIMRYLGEEGYKKIVKEVMEATQRAMDGIREIEDLRVLGKPDMCLFCFESDTINVFQLADQMRNRGWYVQPQLSRMSPLPNLHISINYVNTPYVDDLLKNLRESVQIVKKIPPLDVTPFKDIIEQLLQLPSDDLFEGIASLAGISDSGLPEEMVLINSVLNILPPSAAETLLIEYFNNIFV